MTSVIRAVIIDDELGCISNLKYYIAAYCPAIKVVATGMDLTAARDLLENTQPDILFLDIELCNDNIFDFLDNARPFNSKIVFVTAYDQYAVKAFKVDALDYITKPLLKEDIIACYEKIKKWQNAEHINQQHQEHEAVSCSRSVKLRQGERIYIVKISDILYLEAKGIYTSLSFLERDAKRTILVSKLLSRIENEYDDPCFFRIHRSFIINVSNVLSITKHGNMNVKLKTGDIIPIAKRRMNEFLTHVQLNSHL